jgi:hypothetical protein
MSLSFVFAIPATLVGSVEHRFSDPSGGGGEGQKGVAWLKHNHHQSGRSKATAQALTSPAAQGKSALGHKQQQELAMLSVQVKIWPIS